jgi:hypothetical protein
MNPKSDGRDTSDEAPTPPADRPARPARRVKFSHVFISHTRTVRELAGKTQQSVADLANKMTNNKFRFTKKRISYIEANKPLPAEEAEAYLAMLHSLAQKSKTSEIITSLRKKRSKYE